MDYDLIVIGGGPAGYVGAIRAAQLGKKVAVVEVERAGGTCLNWGCIPTKALLKSAEVYHTFQRAEEFGLKVKGVDFDFKKVIERSRGVADQMAKGIEYLFKKNKIDYILGRAEIQKDKSVIVTDADGKQQTLTATNLLIATGAKPRSVSGLDVDGEKVLSSKEALIVDKLPSSIVIIGAGAIGVEFAYFFSTFGTKVTLVEMMPDILPVEDDETSAFLNKTFSKAGIDILTETKFENLEATKKGVKVTLSGKEDKVIEADKVLVAIGLQANTEGLLAEGVKLADFKGYLTTDDRYQTSMEGVYAAGDIIGPPWLAHVASFEAIQAVEGMFVEGHTPRKVDAFPGCTYCQPQVASVGLTERAAKEQGLKYKVGKFPYQASGRAVAVGEPEGFIKVITGAEHGEILGAHIVGSEATELIAELGLAIGVEATVDEIHATIHAHPTLAEMIAEASLATHDQALHI